MGGGVSYSYDDYSGVGGGCIVRELSLHIQFYETLIKNNKLNNNGIIKKLE